MDLDTMTTTKTCNVCAEERPDAAISVALHPIKGLEDQFPATAVIVRHCNDQPDCVRTAHMPAIWGLT